jgi:hypothetical protein
MRDEIKLPRGHPATVLKAPAAPRQLPTLGIPFPAGSMSVAGSSAKPARAYAVLFVTPEYNRSISLEECNQPG